MARVATSGTRMRPPTDAAPGVSSRDARARSVGYTHVAHSELDQARRTRTRASSVPPAQVSALHRALAATSGVALPLARTASGQVIAPADAKPLATEVLRGLTPLQLVRLVECHAPGLFPVLRRKEWFGIRKLP